eukprot:6210185-Pleurochrysis_carterae.AAC.1
MEGHADGGGCGVSSLLSSHKARQGRRSSVSWPAANCCSSAAGHKRRVGRELSGLVCSKTTEQEGGLVDGGL